ncbi:MAG: FKBP-type peptidyl-prolyl cis-trans isomerase [Thermoanaerobaculia bacterium]
MKPVYSVPVCVFALLLATLPACAAQDPDADQQANGATEEEDRTFYALGLALSQGLAQFHLSDEELADVQEGLADGVMGEEPEVDVQEYMERIQQLAQERAEAAADEERAAGASALEEAGAQEGAVKTESGMVYRIVEEGTGESPGASDRVRVHYRGTLRDGTQFDSSYDRGEPAEFGLNQVIPCWTEGVQQMKPGGKAELVCPPELAYGDQATGNIPPGSTLFFEVELLEVLDAEAGDASDAGAAGSEASEGSEGDG